MFEKKRKGTDINQSKMAPEEMNEDFDLPGKEKEIGRQVLGKKNNRLKVKGIPKNGGGVQDGYRCWQTPSLDIMENIESRLGFLDRIRLRFVCKYWSSIAMRRDIRCTAPPFPWPGEKRWSIFPMLDYTIESPLDILFTSSGMLYVLVENYEIKNGGVITRRLRFEDGDELELKVVYDKKEKSRKDLFHSWSGTALEMIVEDRSYLIESATRNEVLIHQIRNQMAMTDFDRIKWTRNFSVYKIDPGNDRIFNKEQSLGNQILFISSQGCSLSLPVSSSKGLKANCIHFVQLGVWDRVFRRDYHHGSGTSQVFYLDGRKFEDSVYSEMLGLSWRSPTV